MQNILRKFTWFMKPFYESLNNLFICLFLIFKCSMELNLFEFKLAPRLYMFLYYFVYKVKLRVSIFSLLLFPKFMNNANYSIWNQICKQVCDEAIEKLNWISARHQSRYDRLSAECCIEQCVVLFVEIVFEFNTNTNVESWEIAVIQYNYNTMLLIIIVGKRRAKWFGEMKENIGATAQLAAIFNFLKRFAHISL